MENTSVVARGYGGAVAWGRLGGYETVWGPDCGDGYTIYTCIKIHKIHKYFSKEKCLLYFTF